MQVPIKGGGLLPATHDFDQFMHNAGQTTSTTTAGVSATGLLPGASAESCSYATAFPPKPTVEGASVSPVAPEGGWNSFFARRGSPGNPIELNDDDLMGDEGRDGLEDDENDFLL